MFTASFAPPAVPSIPGKNNGPVPQKNRDNRGPKNFNRPHKPQHAQRGPVRQNATPRPQTGPVGNGPRTQPNRTNSRRPEKNFKKKGGPTMLVTRRVESPSLPLRDDNVLRVIPIGGFDETGARNCMAIEYKRDIIIVDAGLMFPEEDMPGIDYIIPDISMLRGRERDIRGVFITHAHLDHMGALPHILPRIGNPPVYSSLFTSKLIQKKHLDFPSQAKPITQEVKAEDILRLGSFEIEAFHAQHSVPDAIGLVVRTPSGTLFITGDWKFDSNPVHDAPTPRGHIESIAKRGVTVMFGDSTNSNVPGGTIPEQTVMDALEKIFKETEGRIIASTTGSNVRRIQQMITLAVNYGRKVAVEGFSMRTAVEIAQELKYIEVPKGTIISSEETNGMPPSKVLIICTGAQAEEQAVLMRIVNKEHRTLAIQQGDAVIFSSSAIPGNERAVGHLKDYLSRQGAEVYHNQMMDVHSSGHGKQEDLKEMLDMVKPEFFVPAYGDYYHRKVHGRLAQDVGIAKDRILYPDNGQVIEVRQHEAKVMNERYPINYIMVDGLGVGDLADVVLRDRQILASDGIIVAIIKMAHSNGEMLGKADIVSRGFVYMKEQKALIDETQKKIKEIMEKTRSKDQNPTPPNEAYVKSKLRDDLGQFLFTKTQRRPMIIPLLIEV
jgi:ribonuclease J